MRYPPTRAKPGTAHLVAEQHRREFLARLERSMEAARQRERAEDLASRVSAAGVDPDSELGQRLLRKVERADGYLCLAQTRRGTLCIALGSGAGWRCRLHGGASSGPKTEEGRARALANLVQNRRQR